MKPHWQLAKHKQKATQLVQRLLRRRKRRTTWQLAYDATRSSFPKSARKNIADMALEIALVASERHDQGQDALPDLARHHARRISKIIQHMIEQPSTAAEVMGWLKLMIRYREEQVAAQETQAAQSPPRHDTNREVS